jgi:hypothetical protein
MRATLAILAIVPAIVLGNTVEQMCQQVIDTNYDGTSTAGCSASQYAAFAEAALDFGGEIVFATPPSSELTSLCNNACLAPFRTAIQALRQYEIDNSVDCSSVFFVGADTDTDTETDVEIQLFDTVSDGLQFYNTMCEVDNNQFCIAQAYPNGVISGSPAITCDDFTNQGCCAGVFLNCYSSLFDDGAEVCAAAAACGVDLSSDTCTQTANGCPLFCVSPSPTSSLGASVTPSPSPARGSLAAVKSQLTLAPLTCDLFTSTTMASLEEAARIAVQTFLNENDVEIRNECSSLSSKQTETVSMDVTVFTADTATANSLATTMSTGTGFTDSIQTGVNTAISSGSLSGLGLPSVTSVTATTPTVVEPSTSGAGLAVVSALAAVLAVFAHWLM